MPPEVADLISKIGTNLTPILSPAWEIFKDWWWLPLPFILWGSEKRPGSFIFLWLWWRIDIWISTIYKPVLLEIKIPKDNLKPIRAMEDVISSLHAIIYHPPDWWEKWIDGQVQTTLWFEMISVGGEIHFYVRIHSPYRDAVESAIYAQFPEAEITQAQDYTKFVPSDIPNKDWDLWGADYKMMRKDWYPLKTYKTFETETEALEEKRVDPMASLLEAMAKIKPGEQIWFQYGLEPVAQEQKAVQKWIADGEALRNTLAKRPDKPEKKPMAQEAGDLLFSGKIPGQDEEKVEDVIPPEMRLTPGEKEIVTAIELKMTKAIFNTQIRFIYLGKKDVWFKQNFRLAFSFFSQYETAHLNALFPDGKTLTKIHKHWFLPVNIFLKRRSYLRRRRLFRNYTQRWGPYSPRSGGTFMLNTEEAASLFHFPSWIVAPVPGVSRVEAKKGPPPDLLNE
jgi:hypothetical protein